MLVAVNKQNNYNMPSITRAIVSIESTHLSTHVLVVQCNRNDFEMDGLAASVAKAEENQGFACKTVAFEDLDQDIGQVAKLIFVGHHNFYDKDLNVIPLKERKIGDYSIRQVREKLCNAIFQNKVAEIQFYTCEIAMNEETRVVNNPVNILEKDFQTDAYVSLMDNLKNKRDSKIDTLSYLCACVFKNLRSQYDNRTVILRGLTGLGYIDSTNPIPRSFDRIYLDEVAEIESIRKAIKCSLLKNHKVIRNQKKQLHELEQTFETRRVAEFSPPHQYEFHVSVDADCYLFEAEKF